MAVFPISTLKKVSSLKNIILFFSILISCLYSFAWAEADNQIDVKLGIFPYVMRDFKFDDQTYRIYFDIWTVTKDKDFDPTKRLIFSNSLDYNLYSVWKGRVDDQYYTSFRYQGINFHDWNIKYFPFDKHILKLVIQDSELSASKINFIADTEQSMIFRGLDLRDWQILGLKVKTQEVEYNTNFGLLDKNNTPVSQFVAEIKLQRNGLHIFLNFFIGFLAATILCVATFFITSESIDSRSQFLVSAFLLVIGNKYITDRYLPSANVFTFTDAIQISTFLLLLCAVFTIIITYKHTQKGLNNYADKISRRIGIVATLSWIAFLTFFLVQAYYA